LRRNDASDATENVALLQDDIDAGKIDWPLIDASGTPEQTNDRVAAFLPQLKHAPVTRRK
jgi:uncharacterized protein